jgi:DNA repair exonuclease SbcCD ATPase subunit
MIKLVALNQTGIFSYGFMPTLILNDRGTVFVQGVNEDRNNSSNGSGKSSFLNSIKEIAFGKNDTGKSGANVINNHVDWKNGCFGALWLYDINNIFWRIFMLNKWKGKNPNLFDIGSELGGQSEVLNNGNQYVGSDIFLERWDGQIWVDERATSTGNKIRKDTQQKIINEVVGMTYDQFSAYVCLGQKAESALVQGTSGTREKIVQAVVDVSIWDKASIIINRTYNTKEGELTILQSRLSGLESVINTFSVPSDEEIQQMKDSIKHIDQHIQQNITELGKLSNIIKEKGQQIEDAKLKNDGVQQELDILISEENHTINRYNNYEYPIRPADLDILDAKTTKLDIMINQNVNKLDIYDKLNEGNCPTCDQKITADHLLTEMARLENSNVELEEQIGECRIQFDIHFNKYQKEMELSKKEAKDKYEHSRSLINKRREELQNQIINIPILQSYLKELQSKENAISTDNFNLNNQITTTQVNIDSMLARKQEHEQSKQMSYKLTESITNLSIEITHLKWVERNLKKLKIQEYESSINRLNDLIASELTILWGTSMTARFVTAKEKAKGGVKQELDLIVQTSKKPSVPIEMYSGGELKVIVIAVFKAMRKLANERSIGVNISAIDEIDKDLDDYSTDTLVESFNSIAEDSSSCFVISHNSRLLNTMRFNDIWTFRKKDEFVTLDGKIVEAVA